jgi:hypothetical protein
MHSVSHANLLSIGLNWHWVPKSVPTEELASKRPSGKCLSQCRIAQPVGEYDETQRMGEHIHDFLDHRFANIIGVAGNNACTYP